MEPASEWVITEETLILEDFVATKRFFTVLRLRW